MTTRTRGSGSSPAPGRSFCAGADLKDGAGSVGTWPGSFWEIPTINSYESGLELWKPTIAAVNGHCLGYGLTSVTRCDFVIAADDAVFGFPEVRLGVPTIVGALRLPERVGLVERDGAPAHRRPHRRGASPRDGTGVEGRAARRPARRGAPRSPTVCCRPRRSRPGPRRRWRRAGGVCRGQRRSASARPCAGSWPAPRTPPRAWPRPPRPRAELARPLIRREGVRASGTSARCRRCGGRRTRPWARRAPSRSACARPSRAGHPTRVRGRATSRRRAVGPGTVAAHPA